MTYLAKYYIYIECETCDTPIEYGPCATTYVQNGYPMVNVHEIGELRFWCDHCGATTYTGEVDTEHEPGNHDDVCSKCGGCEAQDECECEEDEDDE